MFCDDVSKTKQTNHDSLAWNAYSIAKKLLNGMKYKTNSLIPSTVLLKNKLFCITLHVVEVV